MTTHQRQILKLRRQLLAQMIERGEHRISDTVVISQRKLAALLGVTPPTVRRWMKEDHPTLYWEHYRSFSELWAKYVEERESSPTPPAVFDLTVPTPEELATRSPDDRD